MYISLWITFLCAHDDIANELN